MMWRCVIVCRLDIVLNLTVRTHPPHEQAGVSLEVHAPQVVSSVYTEPTWKLVHYLEGSVVLTLREAIREKLKSERSVRCV